MKYTLNHRSSAQPLSYEEFLFLCGYEEKKSSPRESVVVTVASEIRTMTRDYEAQSRALDEQRTAFGTQLSRQRATLPPASVSAAEAQLRQLSARQTALRDTFHESKRKAKSQLPSLYPHAELRSASGRLRGFSPTGYVFMDFDGVRPEALERAMATFCAPDIVSRHDIVLAGLSPSARGFRVIARVQPDTYRTLYNSGDEMDCRELLVTAEGLVAELGWHPVKIFASSTYYEEGVVDHTVFTYNRKMYLAPAEYIRYGIAEGTIQAMLLDDYSALHTVIDDELHLRYGQGAVRGDFKRAWLARRSAALFGASARPARQKTPRKGERATPAGTAVAADPYLAIPADLELLDVPARTFAHVYFTNACAGALMPPVGSRHTQLALYASLIAPCYAGNVALTRRAMPDFFLGQSEKEIDDIVRSACAKFGKNDISLQAKYTARIAQNESVISRQPSIPASLPDWLTRLGQKYTDCDTNMRMFIMRIFTALASRTTAWELPGRMRNDILVPALHTITVTPTSFGKGNVDKLIMKCMKDKTDESRRALEALEENRQERISAGEKSRKPKKLNVYIPVLNNVTSAAALADFPAANQQGKRVYFPESDMTRNTMTAQKRAWLSEVIKKSSDTASPIYQLRASDAGACLASQPCANIDMLGVETNVKWFLEPSIAAGNDGLIGRFMYCYIVKSYNPLEAQVPVLHDDISQDEITSIVSAADAPWEGDVPADIRTFIQSIEDEQITTLYRRASPAYYDFFQRQLDHAYIVACICRRMSGTFGDKEKALVRFVFDESTYSFGAFLEANLNAHYPSAKRVPHRIKPSIAMLHPGKKYSLEDIMTLFSLSAPIAKRLVARWLREKKTVLTEDNYYTLRTKE